MSVNIELLEQSFAQIKPHSNEFSARFYQILFKNYPQTQPLFAQTNMLKQQEHLISALVLVIDNLQNASVLSSTLKALGARHMTYGTVREHYPMIGETLLKTLEFYLGNAWTPEVKQAWIDAYQVIVNLMLEETAQPIA